MLVCAIAAWVLAANPYLPEGRDLYGKMRYPDAEARLRTAAEVRSSSLEEQREVYDLLARAVVAQGRLGEAEGIYAELLSKDPEVPAPTGVSPKISEAFLRAKRRVYPGDFARLRRLPAAPGRLELELVDPWSKVVAVTLFISDLKGGTGERTLTGEGRRFGATLTPAPGAALRCWAEARDERGRVLDSAGTRDQPLLFNGSPVLAEGALPSSTIAQSAPGPRRWPAYLVTGVTVAMVAAGTALAFSSAADHGSIHADTDARATRALNASAEGKAIGANVAFAGALVGGLGVALLVWSW